MQSGDRVVIIDDVITTGGSTIQAIEKAKEYGLDIVKVIVLVDREEGGRENINKKGYEVESIFTKSELFEEYEKLQWKFKKCSKSGLKHKLNTGYSSEKFGITGSA